MVQSELKQRLSAADYEAAYPESNLPMELIDGEIVMSPAPLRNHQRISVDLTILLGIFVKSNQLGYLEVAPNDVHLDTYNVVQPDLFFVARESQSCVLVDERWRGAPDLCIEILSPSTAKHDRATKRDLYGRFGVREYWIIDPAHQTIEVLALAEGGYQLAGVYGLGDSLSSAVLAGLALDVGALFAGE